MLLTIVEPGGTPMTIAFTDPRALVAEVAQLAEASPTLTFFIRPIVGSAQVAA
jgi:hypothetical protein